MSFSGIIPKEKMGVHSDKIKLAFSQQNPVLIMYRLKQTN
jgi:hypothetical protein